MANEPLKLLRGTLDMLILTTLRSGPRHGYEIATAIQIASDDALSVEEGSLYPALYRLEKRGWVGSEWGLSDNNRKARFYSLTRKGRDQLRVEASTWERFSAAVGKVVRPVLESSE